MTPEKRAERIASELTYLMLTNPGKFSEFAFDFKGQKAIVRVEPVGIEGANKAYISLDPPGETCGCCDGTGVQERKITPPSAAM
ncbi:hypothetical protein [Bradyrhizobium sp. ORS 111]|uniref:hypothetical protein n=1 Tax=Bradyrhizobium sp. ORS 111 TaxID=1685958 RepID=UPI003890D7FB